MDKFFETVGKFLFLGLIVGGYMYLKAESKPKYEFHSLPSYNSDPYKPYDFLKPVSTSPYLTATMPTRYSFGEPKVDAKKLAEEMKKLREETKPTPATAPDKPFTGGIRTSE